MPLPETMCQFLMRQEITCSAVLSDNRSVHCDVPHGRFLMKVITLTKLELIREREVSVDPHRAMVLAEASVAHALHVGEPRKPAKRSPPHSAEPRPEKVLPLSRSSP